MLLSAGSMGRGLGYFGFSICAEVGSSGVAQADLEFTLLLSALSVAWITGGLNATMPNKMVILRV